MCPFPLPAWTERAVLILSRSVMLMLQLLCWSRRRRRARCAVWSSDTSCTCKQCTIKRYVTFPVVVCCASWFAPGGGPTCSAGTARTSVLFRLHGLNNQGQHADFCAAGRGKHAALVRFSFRLSVVLPHTSALPLACACDCAFGPARSGHSCPTQDVAVLLSSFVLRHLSTSDRNRSSRRQERPVAGCRSARSRNDVPRHACERASIVRRAACLALAFFLCCSAQTLR